MIQPILLFMLAKLIAYTLLGALLGLLGSAFTFSPAVKGFIQIAIGVFLVGNALRMFDVHPIFRYFSFEPPRRVTRYIRQVSKREDSSAITPLFLGALTVLIPCGVTQSVMAVAVGTANPLLGAVIMFAFVVGTSPTFVGISWLATHLGSKFQKNFYRVVAVIVLLLGLYTLDGGLTLVGSPISVSGMLQTSGSEAAVVQDGVAQINVTNYGYSPNRLTLPANQPVELRLVTEGTRSCSLAFYIPDLDFMEVLPDTGERVVNIPPQAPGTTMQFMCTMGMYGGVMQFQ
jgi:sulfite exporter TauE/SafE